MLRTCVKNQIPFRYVLNDIWFAAADNMKGSANKRWVKLPTGTVPPAVANTAPSRR